MAERKDLLVEIGTEELPPRNLTRLGEAFLESLSRELRELDLDFPSDGARWLGSPRRLAVRIDKLAAVQPDREEQRLGPNVKAAFDDAGRPTRAADGFARSCGVEAGQLERVETDQGERLAYTRKREGRPATELLPEAIRRALASLPVPRPMRWGDGDEQFIRPVHWVVVLLDDAVVPGTVLGQRIGRDSRGHRFHHPDVVTLARAASYEKALFDARVMVDFAQRSAKIRGQVEAAGRRAGGRAVIREDLLEEVANLVEWPVALTGAFDEEFLSVPAEALISSMEVHQKFFPVVDEAGELRPSFVGVANIESSDPEQVARGYSRVIRPRLADARFFWDVDRRTALIERRPALDEVVYQTRLGSLGAKVDRVEQLAAAIARRLNLDPEPAVRAARLCKCDLLTEMVGEFPELQGVMGRYYAAHDGEDAAVAAAIEAHYRPRFGGDDLPDSDLGRVLALADRIDTLAGIFAVDLRPTGNKDPFALRRAALGVARLCIEGGLDLDIEALVEQALAAVAEKVDDAPTKRDEVVDFVFERMRAYYAEQGVSSEVFNAVRLARPTRLADFDRRLQACSEFAAMAEAEALAAANKRIGNILKKAQDKVPEQVDADRLVEDAERALADQLQGAAAELEPLLAERRYRESLIRLSTLREPVDRFFDEVLVMADDAALRRNRLALLARLKGLFDNIADIAQLAQAR